MEQGFSMDQALQEASRCLLCQDAPCSSACPADTQPDRFIRKFRFKNLKGAAALIKRNNVLGGVCGAICPTSCLCEQGCLASGIGLPIAIGKIQRFLVEYGWDVGLSPDALTPPNGRRVAVVGAGPSGLACAAALAREGYEVTVFERLSKPGGMLRHVIPEHRLNGEFVDREISEIVGLGVEIKCGTTIESQADLDSLFSGGYEAVYLATGSWRCIGLNVPARDSDDIRDAISFLNLAKARSDDFSNLVSGKDIAVIGGGDSAMDAAVTAHRHGAHDVFVIYRRSYADMPASQEAKQLALAEGIHFIIMTQPVAYVIEGGRVKGMKVVRCRLGETDESGRRTPVLIKETEHYFRADLVVEAVGLVPEDSMKRFSSLDLDNSNRIILRDENGVAASGNVFAGGDAVRGSSLVVKAVADGKQAAAAIRKAIETTVA